MTSAPVAALTVLGFASIVFAALLVAGEAALSRVSRAEATRLHAEGRRGSAQLLHVLDNSQVALNVSIFVRKTAEALGIACAAISFASIFDSWVVVLVTTALVAGVVLFVVVGVAPRTVARNRPEAVALFAAPWMRGATILLGPVSSLLVWLGNLVTQGRTRPGASEEELRDLVDKASEAEEIPAGERRMLHSVFELADTIVREVMVPRTDVVWVEQDTPLPEAMKTFVESGHSRVPVIGESLDDPVGVLFLKDVNAHLYQADGTVVGPLPAGELMREATWVPESKSVDSLLRQMQRDHSHVALVADEWGGTAGLVTIEDLVEVIVGDIEDEHDQEGEWLQPLGDGAYRLDARTPIDQLNELFGVAIEEDAVDTVAGLLAKQLGTVPGPGATAVVAGIRLTGDRGEARHNRLATVIAKEEAPIFTDEEDQHD